MPGSKRTSSCWELPTASRSGASRAGTISTEIRPRISSPSRRSSRTGAVGGVGGRSSRAGHGRRSRAGARLSSRWVLGRCHARCGRPRGGDSGAIVPGRVCVGHRSRHRRFSVWRRRDSRHMREGSSWCTAISAIWAGFWRRPRGDWWTGLLIDLGVSSPQLDRPERGFSFRSDGPLDMRMDRGERGRGPRDLLRRPSEDELARHHLPVRRGAFLAAHRANYLSRARAGRAAEDQRLATPRRGRGGRAPRSGHMHPATRTFQALRIALNARARGLAAFLAVFPAILAPGGAPARSLSTRSRTAS